MRECGNTEIRELLPDLAADRLTGADRTRVANHVATCPACVAEVELLRAARRAQSRGIPALDTARIVAALPKPPVASSPSADPAVRPSLPLRVMGGRGRAAAAPSRSQRPRISIASWGTWRIAAAATIAVGGLSLLIVREVTAPTTTVAPVTVPVHPSSTSPTTALPGNPGQPAVSVPIAPGGGSASPETAAAPLAGAGLSVGSDLSELSDGDVESLMNDVDSLDARPSADPDAAAPGLRLAAAP